jgi:hypothetical protein
MGGGGGGVNVCGSGVRDAVVEVAVGHRLCGWWLWLWMDPKGKEGVQRVWG